MKKFLYVLSLTAVLGFAADKAVDADNTARNERDKSGRSTTPVDQASGTDADVEVTRLIRKDIIDRDNLSTNAENIKIITLNGYVTLRGPVESVEEKNAIDAIAKRRVTGAARVNNLLEIKKN